MYFYAAKVITKINSLVKMIQKNRSFFPHSFADNFINHIFVC